MSDIILGQHSNLKKQFVDRRIKDLAGRKMIADLLMTKTSVDALSVKFFKDADADANGRYAYEEVPEVGEGSGFKRIGISEKAQLALIRKYGLEAAISYEQQRFGADSYFERVFNKLANSVSNMVNAMTYDRILNDANINKRTKTGTGSDLYWSDVTAGQSAKGQTTKGAIAIRSDLTTAQVEAAKFGYVLDTMVVSPATFGIISNNSDASPEYINQDLKQLAGYRGNFLGLDLIVDEMFADKDVLLVQRGAIGDIADAVPLSTSQYNQDEDMTTVVRALRFTESYVTDPKGVYLLKNIIA
ncbi:phage major capsid protein [Bacillus sp. FSL R9-9410]|uniref:phage major capsid protein n=1 Tax=Bacillus sp. FSL R9-9410 TaxID=2921590 RepID=UPI003100DEBC